MPFSYLLNFTEPPSFSKYGLESPQIPSKNMTSETNIDEVESFGASKYADPTKSQS